MDDHDRSYFVQQDRRLMARIRELNESIDLTSLLAQQKLNMAGLQFRKSTPSYHRRNEENLQQDGLLPRALPYNVGSPVETTICSLDAECDDLPFPSGSQSLIHLYSNPPSCQPLLTSGMLRQELKEQENIKDESHVLITQICDCSDEVFDQPTDEYEWRSSLRYHVIDPISGEVQLASEWVRLLESRPDYIPLTPPNVQQEFEAIEQIKRKTRRDTAQPSLVAWIKKRTENDKMLWNVAIVERNARCNWPLETDTAPLDDTGASSEIIGIAPLTDHNQSRKATIMNKRKRATAGKDGSSSDDTSHRSQKRSSHAILSLQAYSQQAPIARIHLSQPIAPAAGNIHQWSYPMPIGRRTWPYPLPQGQRRGLRPEHGTSSHPYEWSDGRKRAWLELNPFSNSLPEIALNDHWNDFTSCCTSEHADIRLLGDIHVSVIELLSYFPEHIKWRAIGVRLRNAGWYPAKVREFIFWSRQLPLAAMKALTRGAMARQSIQADKWAEKGGTAADWVMHNISTERVKAEQQQLHQLSDYYLADLAEGLNHHPQGVDRGLLTVAVNHATSNHHCNVKLSDLMVYIHRENLEQRYGVSRTVRGRVLDADRNAYSRQFPRSGSSPLQSFWRIGGYNHD